MFLRVLAVGCSLWLVGIAGGESRAPDPFAVFPGISLSADDRRHLDAGEIVVRSMGGRGREVALFGIRPVRAEGRHLAAWVREIDRMKRGTLVSAIGRFSNPPLLADLSALTLDDSDIEAIRECKPDDCDLKLTTAEIARLRGACTTGPDSRPALEDAFRRVVLDRVRAYLRGGHAAVGQYDDGRSPVPLDRVFSSILDRSQLTKTLPELGRAITGLPGGTGPELESFLYWSKETFGARPVTTVVHVVIANGVLPSDVIVAGKQVFATHYMNGSLNLTAIVGSGPGTPHYLVVVNRSEVDVIRGMFSGLTRMVLERRVKSEARKILDQVGQRLEASEGRHDIHAPAGRSELPRPPLAHPFTRRDRHPRDRRAA